MLALVVGDAGDAIQHEADKWLNPLGVAPVAAFARDIGKGCACTEREQDDILKRRPIADPRVLCLGKGAHGGIARKDAAIDVTIHRGKVGWSRGRIKPHLIRQLISVAVRRRLRGQTFKIREAYRVTSSFVIKYFLTT